MKAYIGRDGNGDLCGRSEPGKVCFDCYYEWFFGED